jgi:superfamily I DNA/RNA helicase
MRSTGSRRCSCPPTRPPRPRGWLDFDDLIGRTKQLLTAPDIAQWVLFRLDGGIDHILVDEAQDTSPAQWDIVKRLAEDFASGRGRAREVQRTIFVVGDKKQSIYSFQGADPEGFDRMRDHFDERLRGVGQDLQETDLLYSFRSARPILELVDDGLRARTPTGVGGLWSTRPSTPSVRGAWTSGRVVPSRPRVRTWRGAIRRTCSASIITSPFWPALADRIHAMLHA